MFLETSALSGENVEETFLKCARTILTKIESGMIFGFLKILWLTVRVVYSPLFPSAYTGFGSSSYSVRPRMTSCLLECSYLHFM